MPRTYHATWIYGVIICRPVMFENKPKIPFNQSIKDIFMTAQYVNNLKNLVL